MNQILRHVFYNGFVRLVVTLVLGLNVRHRDRLPQRGPAILVANHNSHLDTMVLTTLMPAKLLPLVRPIAAADYFLTSTLRKWFALNIVGIVPIKRKRDHADEDLLAPVYNALDEGSILIFFPEGSRGEPEQMAELRSGIARLAKRYPNIPVVPVVMHGLGKALPKGEGLLVPFFCDVFVGDALYWQGDRSSYMRELQNRFATLTEEGNFREWL